MKTYTREDDSGIWEVTEHPNGVTTSLLLQPTQQFLENQVPMPPDPEPRNLEQEIDELDARIALLENAAPKNSSPLRGATLPEGIVCTKPCPVYSRTISPLLPPLFLIRRTFSMRIAWSAALHIS